MQVLRKIIAVEKDKRVVHEWVDAWRADHSLTEMLNHINRYALVPKVIF